MSYKIKANKVSGRDECINPGDYFFGYEKKLILFMCPSGCGQLISVPTERWNWNKNEDSPTLAPSIQIIGECNWHGFLTNGEWITV